MQPNTFLWDSTVRGFHARRQFGDAITFAVFYRNSESLQRWHRIGRFGVWTPDQARKEAQRILRARDLGEDPTTERMAIRNAMTVAQLCDEYVSDMQSGKVNGKKESTVKTDISRITTHIKPALGTRKVTGVTQEDVDQFMRGLSPGSARRVTGLLGAIFSYAVEYAQLWSALENERNAAADAFLLLAISGWRSSEAKNLKRSEIDLERRIATLGDTKTGMSVRPLRS